MSDIKEKTLKLIDGLKATCQSYGMGNDGNEYKIITQVFLYKFLNDKFGYELKNTKSDIAKKLIGDVKWETAYENLSDDERMLIQSAISPDVPMLEPYHLIANLWNQQSKGDFDTIFDSTMTDIAEQNADIFSTQTTANTKIPLFEALTPFVTDTAQRAPFARALVDKLVNFSFEEAFAQNYDFFSSIFEYLIKDYNTAPEVVSTRNTILLMLLPRLWPVFWWVTMLTFIVWNVMIHQQEQEPFLWHLVTRLVKTVVPSSRKIFLNEATRC